MRVLKSKLKKFDWKGWAEVVIPLALVIIVFWGIIYAGYLYGMNKFYGM